MSRNRGLALLAGLMLAGCQKQVPVQAKPDTGPVRVTTARVGTRMVQRIVESVGTLFAFDETIISAEVEGRVAEVLVDLGDAVKPGQLLVNISEEEQRYLLAGDEAQLGQALEKLGLASEKDRVKDIRETPEVRRAAAELTEARQRHQRIRQLVDQQIGSRQELDQATARLQAAQASYDATLNQTRNLIQEVERFKAAVALQRKKLRDTKVRAPFAAFVKERQVTAGQFVRPNTPLLVLVKTDPVRLRVEIPERMAPWIKVGQVAEVYLEAFEKRRFEGKIWRIAPTVDQTKRTFVVEALIANPAGELKPGSYARARVPTDKNERVMTVPVKAVNYVLGANKAYVVENNRIRAQEVKIGDRFGNDLEILEGLEPNLEVATSQLNRIDTGTAVEVVKQQPRRATE